MAQSIDQTLFHPDIDLDAFITRRVVECLAEVLGTAFHNDDGESSNDADDEGSEHESDFEFETKLAMKALGIRFGTAQKRILFPLPPRTRIVSRAAEPVDTIWETAPESSSTEMSVSSSESPREAATPRMDPIQHWYWTSKYSLSSKFRKLYCLNRSSAPWHHVPRWADCYNRAWGDSYDCF